MPSAAKSLLLGLALLCTGGSVAVASIIARRAAAIHAVDEIQPDSRLEPVSLPVNGTELSGWIVEPELDGATNRWAVFLPGLGSHELRHQEVARDLAAAGYHCLIASHSAKRPRHRHTFGVREKDEALAWIEFAKRRGAERVVLFGWSFGAWLWLDLALSGRTPLQIDALVFSGPLRSWEASIRHGARLQRIPQYLTTLAFTLLRNPLTSRMAGQNRPVDVRAVDKAALPAVPLLVFHSDVDRVVPVASSRALVARWEGPAFLEVASNARHGAERDVDSVRWTATMLDFLNRYL